MIDLTSVVWIVIYLIVAVIVFALLFFLNHKVAEKMPGYAAMSGYVDLVIWGLAIILAIFFLLSFVTGRPIFR